MNPKIAAVVPVIDEQDAIGEVVAGLRAAGTCCVLVVDGGSRDATREVAGAAGAVIVDEPRRGYGRACLSGAEQALASAPDGHAHDIIVYLDGDGSCDPADMTPLVASLAEADVALGRRPRRRMEPGAMPWHAILGNRLVAAFIARRAQQPIHDFAPFKAVRRAALQRLDLDDAGYGWTVQLVARSLLEPSIRVVEVPVAFRARRGGVSKVSGAWRTSIRAGRAMLGVALAETRPRPVIALMAKAPGAGHAKTRLAVDLGEERTADLWAACLEDVAETTLVACRSTRSLAIAMLARQDDVDPVTRIIGPGWNPVVQARPGLSAALADVFLTAFDRGADRAVAVAGDSPGLAPDRIVAALEGLGRHRGSAVIGPSRDGGFHLVGLRWAPMRRWWPGAARSWARRRLARRLETAFSGVPMGETSALEVTMRGLRDGGWRVATVAAWPDVDTLADLRALASELPADDRWAARTAAWVHRHQRVIDDPAIEPGTRPVGDRP